LRHAWSAAIGVQNAAAQFDEHLRGRQPTPEPVGSVQVGELERAELDAERHYLALLSERATKRDWRRLDEVDRRFVRTLEKALPRVDAVLPGVD
jgi:hypothetical protein